MRILVVERRPPVLNSSQIRGDVGAKLRGPARHLAGLPAYGASGVGGRTRAHLRWPTRRGSIGGLAVLTDGRCSLRGGGDVSGRRPTTSDPCGSRLIRPGNEPDA